MLAAQSVQPTHRPLDRLAPRRPNSTRPRTQCLRHPGTARRQAAPHSLCIPDAAPPTPHHGQANAPQAPKPQGTGRGKCSPPKYSPATNTNANSATQASAQATQHAWTRRSQPHADPTWQWCHPTRKQHATHATNTKPAPPTGDAPNGHRRHHPRHHRIPRPNRTSPVAATF